MRKLAHPIQLQDLQKPAKTNMVNPNNDSIRLRRSVLYMPGSNERAMDKARSLNADTIILDLEDAVAPGVKEDAREKVAENVRAGGFGQREVLVRVNAVGTPWHDEDMDMAIAVPCDGIVLPKVEDGSTVQRVAAPIADSSGEKRLWAMLETPQGILKAAEIAASSTALSCLLMGTTDLANELRLPEGAPVAGLTWSLGASVVAARAHGLDIIDGVHLDIKDEASFRQACQRARAYGFDGKSLIHPSQIEPANVAFAPDTSALEHAERTIAAYEEAEASGSGVAVLDGKLVEHLHVKTAQRTITLARAVQAKSN